MRRTHVTWRAGDHALECGLRTLVMGILNVTPDSFSDGGRYLDPELAVSRGVEMAAEGADILDVGGESTRPGSDPVSPAEERDRVVPVIKRLTAETDVPISIDTRKAEVAAAAIEAGASIVNDVSAADDPAMFGVARDGAAGLVLMHMRGEPKTMQDDPHYDDVVAEVRAYLADRAAAAEAAGIERERLCLDPGLGFGKSSSHSLQLMRENAALAELGYPLLVGPSRKSFIRDALGDAPIDRRREGSLGAVAYLAAHGAHIVRVHDVRPTVEVLRVVDAILSS
ncbi:MAG TPA: dihydropteroate synthase [Actinomycetota bacterium]|nr:dihydropteroate synthase [Actinomycetota bacterium]